MKKTTSRRQPAKALLGLSIALALSGCGGGGGSSAAAGAGSAQFLDTVPVEARTQFANIRTSVPIAGSVSQSTNTDANVTQDLIYVEISGDVNNPRYLLLYDADADGTAEDTIDTDALSADEVALGSQTVNGLLLRHAWIGLDSGVDFDPDGDNTVNGKVFADVYTTYDSAGDTDYIAGGVWLYVPDNNAAAEFAMGAFADGADEFDNISAVSGTATYSGRAAVIFSEITPTSTSIGRASADVELSADFDGSTISGTVSDIGDYSGSINLESATIGSSGAGFFTGNLSGTVEGIPMSGRWGGQFYNDDAQPGAVAGTAGGGGTAAGNEYDFTAAWGGIRQ